jgi:putative glutamine amidotransferase
MKGQPLVALSSAFAPEAGRHQQPQVQLYSAYITSLDQLGLAAVLLTPFHTARTLRALIEHADGLVLSGGGDIDPERYGQEPGPMLDWVDPMRDEMEMTALGLAVQREIPVLGICRGCQVLNVYFGGTLYQDIESERPTPVEHQQAGPWGARSHDVAVAPSSRLHDIVECDTIHINSFHHQAIRDVAPTLKATGVADDGIIEAVESDDHPWLVGVQWHPERGEATTPDTDPDRRLFAAFRQAVVERQGRG